LRGGQRDLRPQRVTVDWGRIDGLNRPGFPGGSNS
jgi:hypothetical protein